jgi:cell filamentation protein
MNPVVGPFNLGHLCTIHQALFQDVYDWAGEIRQVDISKGASLFAHFTYIVPNAQSLFIHLDQEQELKGLSRAQFARRAAYYLGEINVLHPFREGNGRTQRIFFTELAGQAGYTLDWALISPQQMINASVLSLMHGDNSGLEQIFLSVLGPPQP